MPTNTNPKKDYFPPKPEKKESFLAPVSWLGGREFIASLKGTIIYAIYGQNKDARSWMKSNIYPFIETAVPKKKVIESATDKTPKSGNTTNKVAESITDKTQQSEDTANEVESFWAEKIRENWDWKKDNFEFWEQYLEKNPLPITNEQEQSALEEFWVDYVSDTGDGQTGGYSVACLCLSDLWLKENDGKIAFSPENHTEKTLLPRGSFLFIGGDTGYYVADYTTLYERFQTPFRWAFASVRKNLLKNYEPKEDVRNTLKGLEETFKKDNEGKFENDKVAKKEFLKQWDGTLPVKEKLWDTEPLKPLFGVPANHDYYDDIDGFNRQFRRPPYDDLQENKVYEGYKGGVPLKIQTFQREQEASYVALRLPFNFWFFGIDSENEKLDFRQKIFFAELLEKFKPKKLILATPEPTTVFGKKCIEDDKTATYLRDITESMGFEQPFLKNGEFEPLKPKDNEDKPPSPESGDYCRLDLSGDVHHYARYWGGTDTESKPESDEIEPKSYASLVSGGGGAFLHSTETISGKGEDRILPSETFPKPDIARHAIADKIFNLKNLRKGSYVQIIGALIALITYVSLVHSPDTNVFAQFIGIIPITTPGISPITSNDIYQLFCYLGIFLIPIILLFICGKFLHQNVQDLKDVRAKKTDKDSKGRISELRLTVFLFAIGLLSYFVWDYLNNPTVSDLYTDLYNYPSSLILIGHCVIAGLLFWLNIEYGNWVMLKYKYFGDEKEGSDRWLNLFGKGFGHDFIENGETAFSKYWLLYRRYSIKTIPIVFLNVLAILILIFGIFDFKNNDLGNVAMDIIFTIVLFGGFVGIIYLAVGIGAVYQDRAGKFGFFFIGLWHTLLQILTPFILIFYADWWLVIGIFLLTVITNGKALGILTRRKSPNIGTWAMKNGNKYLLTALWISFGVIVFLTPILFSGQQNIGEFLSNLIVRPGSLDHWFRDFSVFFSILIVIYLGYRLSRVWFSWYLAVSSAFDGHNNISGGAARIEDYKHILRIKLTKEEMTVYVIGFDEAKTDLEDLEPKLIEKFKLKCKSIP